MTIVTNVPNSLLRPQTFHYFNYLKTGSPLTSIPLTGALIGAMSSVATATAGVVYDITDTAASDALFGAGSELALNCRKAIECTTVFGRGPRIKAVAVAEPGGGVANVKTITAAGTATSDSNAVISHTGRTFIVGVRTGDTAATVATAVSNAFKARDAELPTVTSVATVVVTNTHRTKGVNGGDVKITIVTQPIGVTLTVANTVVGSGVSDHQPALDALAPLRYDGIAFSNHAAADITEINLDRATRWGTASKTWGYYFVGEPGTIGTATALAAAANHQSTVIANMEGCLNTAGEMATAAMMLMLSRSRPNAGYAGSVVPLFPPNASIVYTGPEVETAIAAGLTVFTGVVQPDGQLTSDRAKCERMVTTRTTTDSLPDDRNRDIAVSRTGVAIAIQLDVATGLALGPTQNPDGVSQDDTSDALIKDLAAAILRAMAADRVLVRTRVEDDIAAMVIEHDGVSAGRDNVLIPYTVALPLQQIAWAHNVRIGA